MIPHKEFVEDVVEKTRPLKVSEESEECMKEGYEYDKDKRGPRSRPEYERRKVIPMNPELFETGEVSKPDVVYTEGEKNGKN